MKRKSFLAKASMMLFAVLFSLTGARAQQALPYSYGFEDNDLSIDGWVLQGAESDKTCIETNTNAAHNGTHGFVFYYSEQNAYLISPLLTGGENGVVVSFYYGEYSNSYGDEQFQVGYTTDENVTDASEFTYGDVITASTAWQEYSEVFPAGTKRIAIKYVFNDTFYFYLDDFSFEAFSDIAKPTGLTATEVGAYSAVLSWTEKGSATSWVIDVYNNDEDEEEFVNAPTNPFTLTDLNPETEYFVRVRPAGENTEWSDGIYFKTYYAAPTALAASDVTANSATITWVGEGDSYNLRYALKSVIFSDDFENGLDQWTVIRNNNGTENTDWHQFDGTQFKNGTNHSGNYVAISRSWSGDEYDVDNWLISPAVTLDGTLSYWVKDDGSYHEHYDIYISTTGTEIKDFTLFYEPGNATDSWQEVTVDLSSFAGQEGYIAFRHTDKDQDFLLIDDVSITKLSEWVTINNATSPYTLEGLTPENGYQVEVQAVYAGNASAWATTSFTTLEDVATPSALAASDVTWGTAVLSWTENGKATAWEVCLNGDEENLVAADTNPFTLTGLTPETAYTAKVRAVNAEKKSYWSNEVAFTTEIRFHAPTDLAASNVTTTSAEISWATDAAATGAVLEYADATGASLTFTEYKYDNGTFKSSVGLGGGAFLWGVMFPAGSYTGTTLSKVSVYDAMAMTGSVTIYNDGDAAPENPVATVPVTFTGIGDFIDIAIDATIDDTKNVWVIFNNESGATYPAATSNDDLGDANGRWVEINGAWYDLANAGISGQCFMVRAEIGTADLSALTWTTVADATSPYELTGLTSETTYAVRVKSLFEEGESKWTSAIFTTESENPVPANIVADLAADGATFTWEGLGESYNVQYRTAEKTGEAIFEDNFDNGLDQWTIVTAGEGPGWVIGTETGGNAATAYSWQSSGSYEADNWLISPAVELGGVLKFTVATATSYPDSYEVLLSTTGTEIADFTVTLQAMATATPGDVTIDLSAYAGQTGHIAFHHVSYDCYLLAIDDFGVYGPNVPASEWQNMAVTEATATISGLATNTLYEYQIQSVKDEKASEWSELADFVLLTLDSDVDNTSLINKYNGKFAHVTLANRTFYKNNSWNTIFLPFDMTLEEVAASLLADADVRTLNSNITIEEKTVTLNFTAEGEALTTWSGNKFYGGVPYIAKWTEGSNIVNPEFANVTITNSKYYVGDSNSVMFSGTYAPISFAEEDRSILFVGAENKLYWPMAGANIGAFRGYFELVGMTAEIAEAGVKQFIMNFGDDDATRIAEVESGKLNVESSIYNLAGQRIGKMQKGINIVNGKKILK